MGSNNPNRYVTTLREFLLLFTKVLGSVVLLKLSEAEKNRILKFMLSVNDSALEISQN